MRNTNEKGITLIALVITITIMIILVGVTVAISINSGLITTTQNAADDTENARIEDEIKTIVVTALEGNEIKDQATLDKIEGKIKNIKGVDEVQTDITSNYPLEIKSKSNKEWVIDKKGKVQGKDELPKMIEFTITNADGNGTLETYYAEEGMTWGEWIEKYKPDNFEIKKDAEPGFIPPNGTILYHKNSDPLKTICTEDDRKGIVKDDVIEQNSNYLYIDLFEYMFS